MRFYNMGGERGSQRERVSHPIARHEAVKQFDVAQKWDQENWSSVLPQSCNPRNGNGNLGNARFGSNIQMKHKSSIGS